MRVIIIAAFAIFIIIPSVLSAIDEKPPLTVSIVVDPLLYDRFKSPEELEVHLLNIISRASLIFNADIGRQLVLDVIEVGLPPNAGLSIDDKSAFAWLKEKVKRHPSRFWVFLIDRPLASCNISGTWSGCGMMNNSISIVVYNSDLALTLRNLLHELGHNCGADHSESKISIMYPWGGNNVTYSDKVVIIRDTCE